MQFPNLIRFLLGFCLFWLPLSSMAQVKQPVHTSPPRAAKPAPDEYAAIDKKALEIPASATTSTEGIAGYINTNFNGNKEKARAAFTWIAYNIQYDLANMFAINFYEKEEDKIAKPLATRKGICENYAALFHDICSKTGIKSFVVEGYTKQNGFTDYIPHAWCAAFIDTAWFLVDPTWGSGYVSGGTFHSRINNYYFLAQPAVLIKSHMPFDYLWQFLYYPVSSQEFYEGKLQPNASKSFFNYPDSIAAYEKLSRMDYYAAAAARIERNGVRNAMQFDQLRHLKEAMESEKVNLFNAAAADFNTGVLHLNEFIDYRNKQFKPEKPDSAIQAMLDTSTARVRSAFAKLDQVKEPGANIRAMMDPFRKQLADLEAKISEQQAWLKKYFSKGKLFRKMMFAQH